MRRQRMVPGMAQFDQCRLAGGAVDVDHHVAQVFASVPRYCAAMLMPAAESRSFTASTPGTLWWMCSRRLRLVCLQGHFREVDRRAGGAMP